MRWREAGARARIAACALLLLCPLALSRHDDDFAFDNGDEFQVELTANHSEIAKNGLRRLWGVPDTSAYVGHLFRMEIPKEAFTGKVQAYKVRSEDGRRMPSWLAVDSRHGLISGIPQPNDVGAHSFTVTAHGRTRGLTATDSFTIEVKKAEEKSHSKYGTCRAGENRLVLVILVDSHFQHIAPRQRTRALMELAHFMALDWDEFSMGPYKAESFKTSTLLMSGPGSTQRRRGDAITAINLNVGCGSKPWPRHAVLVAGLREQSRDGTLSHILKLPVLGWRLAALRPPPRAKRQSPMDDGSGTYDTYGDGEDDADYSGYDDGDADNEDDYESIQYEKDPDPDHKVQITSYSGAASESNMINFTNMPDMVKPRILPHDFVNIRPDESTTEPEMTVIIQASNEIPPSSSEPPTSPASEETVAVATVATVASVATVATATFATTTESMAPPTESTTVPPPTTVILVPSTLPPTTTVETTVEDFTEQETATSTERTSTIVGRTTETITFAMPVNHPPMLQHHLKKFALTAGKAFRYIIPSNFVTDPEEGTNLTFSMYNADNAPLTKDLWIQFIPAKGEVYGLPLETHVSRWHFIVEATDSEGLSARGPLDVTVQQHKSQRNINHEFIMQFKLNKEYLNSIDWQIRALESIVYLFRDTDMDKITVLKATQTGDFAEFVWTNDTLAKDAADCPMDQIDRLMKIMESPSDPGLPSPGLLHAMSPDLIATGVQWRGVGVCEAFPKDPDAFPPVPRNQVDLINATVGHLLVYKVPEDTFYDPEDGGTRNLQLSLRYSDNSVLPVGHWLQFDENNQEFYGLPGPSDEGPVNYKLNAEDSTKKSAYDSLVVKVEKAPTIRPTVEFQMTMVYPFPLLAYNASNKRKVVEKLAALFGQKNTDDIRIQSITDTPTTIIWYNTSLPTDRCPKKEIEELRRMIIADERSSSGPSLLDHVDRVFDKDFKVMSITLNPLGLCAEQSTKTLNKPPSVQHTPPGSAGAPAPVGGYSEYLVTFVVPAVVIVCMIVVASVIACVLYRRRRTGKMSVGDEEERQAFRSKGIPVIFQDELEERGDSEPVHKSPVIMREEKPPLLPPAPDYRSSGEDAPYRPPPPFAASRSPPRPKATPTYRKPPPYVPP